jgi:hypothetical protein
VATLVSGSHDANPRQRLPVSAHDSELRRVTELALTPIA